MSVISEMVNYIFGRLKTTENCIGIISKALKSQKKFNSAVTLFAVVTTANIIVVDLKRKEFEKKVSRLEKELEDLKAEKGE